MPYQLVSAKARAKALDALWEDVDVGNRDINELFASYRRIVLTLTHTAIPGERYLDLADARSMIGVYTGNKTVNAWLTANGNQTLPTLSSIPTFELHPAQYSDIYRAGYKVRLADSTRHPDAELPDRAKPDLLLNRGDVDFRVNAAYSMVTVNGFYHRVAGSQHGLYVLGGGTSVMTAQNNHVGMHSFRNVGALKYVPITQEMVYKVHPDQKFRDYAMVKMPMDLTDKVVFMVLGGYLHVLDKAYYITGDRSIRVDLKALQLIERIYDSIDMIDLSSLGLTPSSVNAKQFAVDDILSDRALLAYLTLQQSFFVVMDKTDIYVRRHPLERMSAPGRFLTPMPLNPLPLISSYGRTYDYMPFPQRGKCVLACDPIYWRWFNYQTNNWSANETVDPTSHSYRPVELPMAWLLEIGRVA